ncbi:MAG: aminotransferase class IV [Thermoanaerobaculia bacterium]
MADVLWFNGRLTTTDERVISVEDRGFQFGDAVYEVFKFLHKRPVFIGDHFRRLQRGLRAIEIGEPWTEESFSTMARELLARTAFDDGIVYVQVTRGEGERSHFYSDHMQPTALGYSRKLRFPDETKKEHGIRVITTPDRRWLHCDVKSVNLLANAMAKKKAQRAGVAEAIFIADGSVREGASSNFFAVRDGRIITHPLDEHILPGVVRDHTIGLALAAKIRVDERPLRDAELLDMQEAFITSTSMGVMPVSEIDGRRVGNGRRGPITGLLQQQFDEAELAE